MNDRLEWAAHARDWPNAEASKFVRAGGLDWHVQRLGSGPALLMLHGTGSSTHSWRGLLPLLAQHFSIIAPDLPGHAFTSSPAPSGMSLPGMAAAVGDLIHALDIKPAVAVGHSAGAAILVRMSLDSLLPVPHQLIGLNGALLPLRGIAGQFFSPLAKMLTLNPFMPRLVAWRAASRTTVARVLGETGSQISDIDLDFYALLFQNPAHVAAALAMMANWDLKPLAAELSRLRAPLALIAASNDRSISSDDAFRVRGLQPSVSVTYVRGLGHLAHEEDPAQINTLLRALIHATPGPAEIAL